MRKSIGRENKVGAQHKALSGKVFKMLDGLSYAQASKVLKDVNDILNDRTCVRLVKEMDAARPTLNVKGRAIVG